MGIFEFFKKKKELTAVDYTVNNLKKGFMLDYFLKTWEVKKVYIYDWGNNSYSREYYLHSGNENLYFNVEDDDELICSVWKKIQLTQISPGLVEIIGATDEGPATISYNNATFVKISSNPAHCFEEGTEDDFYELINWIYQNTDNKELISIDRVGEEEYEVSHGSYVQEFEFSNILPR